MKRIISMILAVMLVLSVAAIAVSAESFHGWDERAVSLKDAIAAYEAENDVTIPTRRYYFQVPDGTNGPSKDDGTRAGSWFNEYNEGLCSVYYWFTATDEQPEAPYPTEEWTGFLCETGDAANIFYVDMPVAVKTIIFNNAVNGGAKPTTPEEEEANPYYFCCAQTENIKLDSALTKKTKSNRKLVYENYPDSFFTDFRMVGEGDDADPNFDGMIYVPTPVAMNVNSFSGAQTIGGNWYYYYGNGCYGYTIDATDMKENCLNPDHDHSNDEPATEPETEEPQPQTDEPQPVTDEPTEPGTEPSTDGPVGTTTYYIIGDFTDWEINDAYALTKNEAAEGEEYVFSNLALNTANQFKVVSYTAGTQDGAKLWYPDGMGNNYGENGEITADGTYDVYFRPNGDGGDDWFYNVIYVDGMGEPSSEPATDEPTEPVTEPSTDEPTEPVTEPSSDEPVGATTYYIVGDFNDWQIDEAYILRVNEAAEGEEYVYSNLGLNTANQFKVVSYTAGTQDGAKVWYPDGMGNNYGENGEITQDGAYNVYFRPNGDGGDDWFYNVIYVEFVEPAPTEPASDVPTEPVPVENKIHFDNTTSDWDEETQVYCHIFEYNGNAFFEWQTKKERCNDNGDGTWTYDLDAKGVVLDPEKMYCVIFSNEDTEETYQLFMDTSCMGDTVYCDGTKTENPVDSSKKSDTAYWRNQDKNEFGPVLAISSVGNVIGSACAPDTTPEEMFENFLTNSLDNARTYSGKNDQQLIDDIKDGLGLADAQVAEAIEKTGAEVEWQPAEIPDEGTGILGDADGDGKVTVIDATYIQKTLASVPTPTKFFEKEADVNASGKPDILDATYIQRKLASIAIPYAVGEKIIA